MVVGRTRKPEKHKKNIFMHLTTVFWDYILKKLTKSEVINLIDKNYDEFDVENENLLNITLGINLCDEEFKKNCRY